MEIKILGKVGISPKGEWQSGSLYQRLDLVSYNNGSFISLINDNINHPTSDPLYQQTAASTEEITQDTLQAITNANLATQNTIEAINSANIATVSASNAAALATEVAEHPDKIVEDYWWKWNIGTKEYEDTGIKAKGDVQYTTFYLDSETGILSQTFDTDLQNTTFSLVSGSLILEINNT